MPEGEADERWWARGTLRHLAVSQMWLSGKHVRSICGGGVSKGYHCRGSLSVWHLITWRGAVWRTCLVVRVPASASSESDLMFLSHFWQCLGLALCVTCSGASSLVTILPFLCSYLHLLITYRELALGTVWLQNASVQLAPLAEVPINRNEWKPKRVLLNELVLWTPNC